MAFYLQIFAHSLFNKSALSLSAAMIQFQYHIRFMAFYWLVLVHEMNWSFSPTGVELHQKATVIHGNKTPLHHKSARKGVLFRLLGNLSWLWRVFETLVFYTVVLKITIFLDSKKGLILMRVGSPILMYHCKKTNFCCRKLYWAKSDNLGITGVKVPPLYLNWPTLN